MSVSRSRFWATRSSLRCASTLRALKRLMPAASSKTRAAGDIGRLQELVDAALLDDAVRAESPRRFPETGRGCP